MVTGSSPFRTRHSSLIVVYAGSGARVAIRYHSWAGFDVIFYFDTGSSEHARLRRKQREELGPEARLIVGHEIVPSR